jgi:hypothetical protein
MFKVFSLAAVKVELRKLLRAIFVQPKRHFRIFGQEKNEQKIKTAAIFCFDGSQVSNVDGRKNIRLPRFLPTI